MYLCNVYMCVFDIVFSVERGPRYTITCHECQAQRGRRLEGWSYTASCPAGGEWPSSRDLYRDALGGALQVQLLAIPADYLYCTTASSLESTMPDRVIHLEDPCLLPGQSPLPDPEAGISKNYCATSSGKQNDKKFRLRRWDLSTNWNPACTNVHLLTW